VEEKKSCFVITPIGDASSDVRRAADGVIDNALEPVLSELAYSVDVSHRMSETGSITKQVLVKLLESDLVVCNLTTLNPNVMYELAVRHASRKPVICIAENGTILPFDIQDDRTIFYENDMAGAGSLAEQFRNMVQSTQQDSNPDNPIYRAVESQSIMKLISGKTGDFEKYIVKTLDNIERKISQSIGAHRPRAANNEHPYLATIIFQEELCDSETEKLSDRLGGRFKGPVYTSDRKITVFTKWNSAAELKRTLENVLSDVQDRVEEIVVESDT